MNQTAIETPALKDKAATRDIELTYRDQAGLSEMHFSHSAWSKRDKYQLPERARRCALAACAELRPQEQRYWHLVAERKGQVDARMQELRWLLEELRVSFFAQELRTPQPVSVKRLDKLWGQINS